MFSLFMLMFQEGKRDSGQRWNLNLVSHSLIIPAISKCGKFSVLIPNFLSLLVVEKGGLMDVDQEDLMILLPSLFSSKDMPDNIV